jgi:uncharacterized repeat protein (TIGR01451 family)
MTASRRFPISFDRWYGVFSSLLGLPPSTAYVELNGAQVEVRMGWAFRSRFPRSAVAAASALDIRPLSRGAHGFGGASLNMGGTPSLGNLSIQKSLPAPGSPDLAVAKTGPATAAPGAVVTYTLSYSNASGGPIPAPATGVQLTDTLPAGLTYVPGSASCAGT